MSLDLPKCRHCGNALKQTLVDLGLSPLANSYVPLDRAAEPDNFYPLHARVCGTCLLVQVDDVVPAEEIFSSEYAYFSSYSKSWLEHCKRYADDMRDRLDLADDSLVLEIASNDGYLLQFFAEHGIPVLGVEPTSNTAEVAVSKGIPTRVEFFTESLATTLVAEGVAPKLICSANVLAHVPDINDFVAGVATLLSPESIYTVEFPHLLNLIEYVQFDTIYHEHFSYLSLVAVENIFKAHGLRVFDVQQLPTHGGSLRVFACLDAADWQEEEGLYAVRNAERAAGLHDLDGYNGFDPRVRAVREGLLKFLGDARRDGKVVAAYGAAAKGNTLLNYCGVGPDLISYCVDMNPAKQETLLPGSRIPVYAAERLDEVPPDYVLILPWNLRDEIVRQLDDLRQRGTRMVTAVPHIDIV